MKKEIHSDDAKIVIVLALFNLYRMHIMYKHHITCYKLLVHNNIDDLK